MPYYAASLAGFLLPALSRAKEKARATQCLNNLKQIGLAMVMYANDNNEALPRSQHTGESWIGTLQPYTGTNVYYCPSDPNKQRLYSYALNDFLLPKPEGSDLPDYAKTTSVPHTSETFFIAELGAKILGTDHFHFADVEDGGGDYSPNGFKGEVDVRRHQNTATYLFVDGHVERLSWTVIQSKLNQSGSRLVNPAGKP